MGIDRNLARIERIHEGPILERGQHWKEAILEFEQNSGLELDQLDTSWNFWMSILYCATIYTTVGGFVWANMEFCILFENRIIEQKIGKLRLLILGPECPHDPINQGYGNIACVTTGGRVATILYAICGIPLSSVSLPNFWSNFWFKVIVILDQLGTFLLRKMKELSCFIDDVLFFLGPSLPLQIIKSILGVKYHLVPLDDQETFVRYLGICRTLARLRLIPSTITLSITDQQEEEEEDLRPNSSLSASSSASTDSSSVTKRCSISVQVLDTLIN